jgi:hypothetical protein
MIRPQSSKTILQYQIRYKCNTCFKINMLHTFRSIALNMLGSFEVETYASNKKEPVYIRNLSSANITWNIGCIELPNVD